MDQTAAILVLEDDLEMRTVLAQLLEENGYRVTAVALGHEAVVKLAERPFDLVVADVRVEGIDGLEVVELSRQQQPSIATLIISGEATDAEALRARDLTVGGFLKKPFRLDEFLQQVREQLRGKLESDRSRQQSASRRVVLMWALESLSRVADQTGLVAPTGTLARIGNLSVALGRALQLPEAVCQELRLGAQLLALESVPMARPPRSFLDDTEMVPALSSCLRSETFEHQVASLAGLAGAQETLPETEELARRTEFGPELLQAYERARHGLKVSSSMTSTEVVTGLWDPGRKVRSLLALGKSLERAGDPSSAFQAYGQALSSSPTGQQAVQALLCQARVSLVEGRTEQAGELASAAIRRATALGPVVRAHTLLEAGLLLSGSGQPAASEFLLQAAQQHQNLGLSVAAARARAALGPRGCSMEILEESLELLLEPHNSKEFLLSFSWLIPRLLEVGRLPRRTSWFFRLVTAYPREVASVVRSGGVGKEGRERLVAFLESETPHLTEELYEALAEEVDPGLRRRVSQVTPSQAPGLFLRVVTFGYLELYRGQELVDDKTWKTQKTKYLFAFLASRWGQTFTEDRILDEFWPDDREKGKKNLYWSTSVARRCLKGPEDQVEEILTRERGLLSLNPEVSRWHDLEEFEKAYQEGIRLARQGHPEKGLASLRRLAILYQGPYLEGCYLDWAVRERNRLERQAAEGLTLAAELLLSLEQNQEAVTLARQAAEIQPVRQEAHLALMKALVALGRPEEAIAQYRQCEAHLRKEYDLEPITELIEYYHRARLLG